MTEQFISLRDQLEALSYRTNLHRGKVHIDIRIDVTTDIDKYLIAISYEPDTEDNKELGLQYKVDIEAMLTQLNLVSQTILKVVPRSSFVDFWDDYPTYKHTIRCWFVPQLQEVMVSYDVRTMAGLE